MAIISKAKNFFSGFKPKKKPEVTPVGVAPEGILKKPTTPATPEANATPMNLPPASVINGFSNLKPKTTPAPMVENQAGVQGQAYLQQALSGQPSIDTSAEFRAGDRALARGANDLRNANAQAMAQSGQMGQGQEVKSAQATEQNIFSQLTGRETEKAVQGIQAQKDLQARQDTTANTLAQIGLNRDTLQINREQYDNDDEYRMASLRLSEQAQKSADYFKTKGLESETLKNIMEVAGDNPAVVRKVLKNYMTSNGMEYTQADQDEMDAYMAYEKSRPEAKSADLAVELLNLQIQKAKQDLESPSKQITASKLATGDVSPDDFSDEDWANLRTSEISAIKKTNDYKVWDEMPGATNKVWNQTNQGEVVFVGSVPYRYEGDLRLTNLKTGEGKQISVPPKTTTKPSGR